MTSERFDITPDIRLLEAIGSASYAAPDAICELLANSFDAKVDNSELVIEIDVKNDSISIIDNAAGMSKDILHEAMRLSANMDNVTGNTRTRKGMYGLGLKAACSSLGFHWHIATRCAEDTKHDYVLQINLKDWLSKTRRSEWEIEIDTVERDIGGPLGNRSQGTAIILTKLRERNPMPGAIMEKISQAYGPHLTAGDRILINGTQTAARQYTLVDDQKWPVDIVCGASDEFRITGWVGLDVKTHNDGLFGLNLYRENQLVDAWNKNWFRAHLMTSRIVGEIHLNFVKANFHKQGFEKTSAEWKLASEVMRNFLKPVAAASSAMAKGRNDPMRKTKAMQGLDSAIGVVRSGQVPVPGFTLNPDINGSEPTNAEVGGATSTSDKVKPTSSKSKIGGSLTELQLEENAFTLSSLIENLDDPTIPWDYLFEKGDLVVILNSESTLFKSFKNDLSILGRMALSECVVGFLIKERGLQYSQAKAIRDRWLHIALGGVDVVS